MQPRGCVAVRFVIGTLYECEAVAGAGLNTEYCEGPTSMPAGMGDGDSDASSEGGDRGGWSDADMAAEDGAAAGDVAPAEGAAGVDAAAQAADGGAQGDARTPSARAWPTLMRRKSNANGRQGHKYAVLLTLLQGSLVSTKCEQYFLPYIKSSTHG